MFLARQERSVKLDFFNNPSGAPPGGSRWGRLSLHPSCFSPNTLAHVKVSVCSVSPLTSPPALFIFLSHLLLSSDRCSIPVRQPYSETSCSCVLVDGLTSHQSQKKQQKKTVKGPEPLTALSFPFFMYFKFKQNVKSHPRNDLNRERICCFICLMCFYFLFRGLRIYISFTSNLGDFWFEHFNTCALSAADLEVDNLSFYTYLILQPIVKNPVWFCLNVFLECYW